MSSDIRPVVLEWTQAMDHLDGKIFEVTECGDLADFLGQVGALPPQPRWLSRLKAGISVQAAGGQFRHPAVLPVRETSAARSAIVASTREPLPSPDVPGMPTAAAGASSAGQEGIPGVDGQFRSAPVTSPGAASQDRGRADVWRSPTAGQAGGARQLDLTPREIVVLQLMAEGLTAVSVGRRLGCSPRTVQKHIENMYRKLGVRDRVSAVLEGQRRALAAR